MATLLPRQDIMSQAVDVKGAFSSWDGCMAKAYCKYVPFTSTVHISG
jgi:hypothetical protein